MIRTRYAPPQRLRTGAAEVIALTRADGPLRLMSWTSDDELGLYAVFALVNDAAVPVTVRSLRYAPEPLDRGLALVGTGPPASFPAWKTAVLRRMAPAFAAYLEGHGRTSAMSARPVPPPSLAFPLRGDLAGASWNAPDALAVRARAGRRPLRRHHPRRLQELRARPGHPRVAGGGIHARGRRGLLRAPGRPCRDPAPAAAPSVRRTVAQGRAAQGRAMSALTRGGGVRHVNAPAATLAAILAALAAVLPSAAVAAAPAWLTDVRDAAYSRARAPLEGEALDAALRERRRAAAGALPSLRLNERSHLGLDGVYGLTLDAGVAIPLLAPTAPADALVTTLRLAITQRQLAAQRRAEVHDALAQAAALLAARARARPWRPRERVRCPRPARGLRQPHDRPSRDAGSVRRGRRPEPDERPHTRRRRRPPPAGRARSSGEGSAAYARGARAGPCRSRCPPSIGWPLHQRAAHGPLLGVLGFTAAELQPRRCQVASDAVVLAHLSAAEQRASSRLREARAAPRVDLELGGAVDLGGTEPVARYTLRMAASVRLPPWSPASGAASLSAGASGLEQETTLTWPNRTPGPPPPPGPPRTPSSRRSAPCAPSSPASRARSATWRAAAPCSGRRWRPSAGEPPDGAYLRATLALQLADAEQALDLTALDAALLCGALPP